MHFPWNILYRWTIFCHNVVTKCQYELCPAALQLLIWRGFNRVWLQILAIIMNIYFRMMSQLLLSGNMIKNDAPILRWVNYCFIIPLWILLLVPCPSWNCEIKLCNFLFIRKNYRVNLLWSNCVCCKQKNIIRMQSCLLLFGLVINAPSTCY